MLPARFKHLEPKFQSEIHNVSNLMYQLTKVSLLQFMEDDGNKFLLTYFYENEGLAATAVK